MNKMLCLGTSTFLFLAVIAGCDEAGVANGGDGGPGTGGTSGEGGAAANGGPGTGGVGGEGGDGGAAGGKVIWPNSVSSANSDAWLIEHHTEIQEIHPRFIVLDFANTVSSDEVKARFQTQRATMMDASRYHGYKDSAAQPFLYYELAYYVNLKDEPGSGSSSINSSKFPRRGNNINFGALFTQEYADLYGIKDPSDASRNMTLCELFNAGMVNDIFVAFTKQNTTESGVPEIVEFKQVYDDNDQPIPGQFNEGAGNGSFASEDIPYLEACGRSVRIGFLEMDGNFTNAIECDIHNYESMRMALPRWREVFEPFLNFDLQTRYGTPFSNWYACSYSDGSSNPCLTYPTDPEDRSVTWSIDGQRGVIQPFHQGCGNAHFPSNARWQYDKSNPQEVYSTCEHYGLHDAPDGSDIETKYSRATVESWASTPIGQGFDGGGWFAYWFQSWPGYGNKATTPDGSPMKNWWVYRYY